MGLLSEKVTCISSSSIRCTVSTESGKVATWMDESVVHVASKLEHPAQSFSESLQGQKFSKLFVCNLFSLGRTDSNCLFWWGVLPFGQRKKLWEKYRSKSKKQNKMGSSGTSSTRAKGVASSGDITVGCQVVIRASPLYQSGSIGFTTAGGIPKVGQLLNAAWSLNDRCRFKV